MQHNIGNVGDHPQSLDEHKRMFELRLAKEDMDIAIDIERQRQALEISLLEIMHMRVGVYRDANVPESDLIALVKDHMARDIPYRLNSINAMRNKQPAQPYIVQCDHPQTSSAIGTAIRIIEKMDSDKK
jgi:hypothetical protein